MAIRIQLRRGTAAEWTAANPVLATGEQGLETDTGKTKVGDGSTAWASLPYPVDDAAAAAVAPVTPGAGEVIVGTADGPVARSAMVFDAPRAMRPIPAKESVVSDMGASHGWSRTTGDAANINLNDASDGMLSRQHISATTTAAATVMQISNTGLNLNLQDNLLRIYIKIENAVDVFPSLTVYAHSGSNFYTKSEPQFASQPPFFLNEWQVYTVDFADDFGRNNPATPPDLTTVDRIQIRMVYPSSLSDQTGLTIRWHLGGVTTVPRKRDAFPNGVVSFTYDDGYVSQYTHALPILAKAGFRATAHLICDRIGSSPSFMTLEQIKRLHDVHGWEIGAHAATLANHDFPLGELPPEQVEEDFSAQRSWFAANGLGAGDHHAWPLGAYTQESMAIARRYFTSARSINTRQQGQHPTINARERLHRLFSHPMDNTALNTLPSAAVDRAYDNGAWLIFFGHKLDDTASGSLTAKTSEFQALVDYVKAKGIPVLPTGEVIERLSRVDV